MRSRSTRPGSSYSDRGGTGRGRLTGWAAPRARAVGAVALLAAATGGACDTGVLRPQQDALHAARERWAAAEPTSYTFEVQRVCFCIEQYVRPMRIAVEDGVVVSAVYADDGTAIPGEIEPPTVTDLLDEIQTAIDEEADSIEASYDAEFGYPLDVSIDFIERAVDEEMAFRVHDFDPGAG